jgi:sensor histidine kinase regulating citrate/malate metabolism
MHVVLIIKTKRRPVFSCILFTFADDGGGMDPERIRKCMSLGYSSKKSNTTIGQCNDADLFVPLAPSIINLCA